MQTATGVALTLRCVVLLLRLFSAIQWLISRACSAETYSSVWSVPRCVAIRLAEGYPLSRAEARLMNAYAERFAPNGPEDYSFSTTVAASATTSPPWPPPARTRACAPPGPPSPLPRQDRAGLPWRRHGPLRLGRGRTGQAP